MTHDDDDELTNPLPSHQVRAQLQSASEPDLSVADDFEDADGGGTDEVTQVDDPEKRRHFDAPHHDSTDEADLPSIPAPEKK